MVDIRKLLDNLASQEEALKGASFVAPCVKNGRVRVKVGGLVQTFRPEPRDFEGWGVFQPKDARTAVVLEEAGLPLVAEYLRLFPAIRLCLAWAVDRRTWLAYPANEGDVVQRLGSARPMLVRLVEDGGAFEQVSARWDGAALWYEERDRRADPAQADRLREAIRAATPPNEARFPGLTPEMRTAYSLAAQQAAEFIAQRRLERDRGRLDAALALAGGELMEFHDREGFWQVEWRTSEGERHTSAISKTDLTVVSSGVCLSGRDRDFDLQSLVGVMEHGPDWWQEGW